MGCKRGPGSNGGGGGGGGVGTGRDGGVARGPLEGCGLYTIHLQRSGAAPSPPREWGQPALQPSHRQRPLPEAAWTRGGGKWNTGSQQKSPNPR